ncbi:MAG: nicotinic acid mononucleotide adenyltransferase [Maribacter sp.]|nr:nicotinic acid mononucleotide adenyltransferase [Maribacter sp.]
MRIILVLLSFVFTSAVGFSQKQEQLKLNEETNLIEATYYYDNGAISQKGTFDLAGKLQGQWVSFDENGKKTAIGKYNKGMRTGKWSFWADGIIKEVEFDKNSIASITKSVDTSNRVVIKE